MDTNKPSFDSIRNIPSNSERKKESETIYSRTQIEIREIFGLALDLKNYEKWSIDYIAIEERVLLLIENFIQNRSNFLVLRKEVYDEVIWRYNLWFIGITTTFMTLLELSWIAMEDMDWVLFGYPKLDI